MKYVLVFGLANIAALYAIYVIGRKFRPVSRYERHPEKLTDWQRLDRGDDPSERS